MDFEGALRARIVNAATTAGSKVYWEDRPQSTTPPDVTLSSPSDPRPQHLKGFDALRETLVQADVRGLSFAAKRALREAVIAAVVPENTSNGIQFNRAMVENVIPASERTETQFIFRDIIEFRIPWQTA